MFFIIVINFGLTYAQQVEETFRIAGVTVEGNKIVDPETIIVLSGLRAGDEIQMPFDQKINTAIKNLWKRKLFSDVQVFVERITNGGVFLTIKVCL